MALAIDFGVFHTRSTNGTKIILRFFLSSIMLDLLLEPMKNGHAILLVITLLVAGCKSKPTESGSEATATTATERPETYYPELDQNKCLRVLFPDYRMDSVYEMHSYQNPLAGPNEDHVTVVEEATGKVDTSWYWTPKTPADIALRYENRLDTSSVWQRQHLDERIINRNGRYWIKYSLSSYVANDSVIALLYEAENIVTNRNRGWTGAAVFKKTPRGWFLARNDYNFYNRFAPDIKAVDLVDVQRVNGKPSLLFIGESHTKKSPLRRALLLTDCSLIASAIPAGHDFEVEGGKYKRSLYGEGYNGGSRLTMHEKGISTVISAMLSIDSCNLVLVLNAKGSVVKLRFVEPTDPRRGPAKELLVGKIVERSVPIRYAPQDAASYEPDFRVVDLWKNAFRKTATFYTGTQLHAYAEGSLQDSASVFAQGARKLEERRVVAREADAFNRNLDQHMREAQAQQQQNRAVDEIIRKAGLCQYCSGRGCSQCGGTGRSQKL